LNILTSGNYLWRAIRVKATEYALSWYRAGRVDEKKALQISERVWPIIYHLPLSLLPIGLHKFFTDKQYAQSRLNFIFVRPFRLYFNAHLREVARGLYVLYLVIKERNFKDYNIAVFLAFFKYIGYLAFPIQMTYRYPALARFMAGHWATEAVHIVPVFGEGGALLEHKVFNLFYNWPLTIRGRMIRRAKRRRELAPRSWHISLIALVGATIFGIADYFYLSHFAELPTLKTILNHSVGYPKDSKYYRRNLEIFICLTRCANKNFLVFYKPLSVPLA